MANSASLLEQLRDLLIGPVWHPLARGAWCRRQRRRLRGGGTLVVWVPRESVAWAIWGADNGFFTLGRMDGIPYLSARALPAA
jgi:hypothetical protein